ncbi:hypothetical protein XM38_002220 [Halomicronema hongdechloris C2206]|uniref:Uncharacterized protein n=1 Tax=Halomicronema hongdechloris C2206 TaxID=1641165 RepID=A0A1Z3HGA4_9CYAN|nr:hypothetical protein XM38_002220 [Halomicronema hongdechloris C2206]
MSRVKVLTRGDFVPLGLRRPGRTACGVRKAAPLVVSEVELQEQRSRTTALDPAEKMVDQPL